MQLSLTEQFTLIALNDEKGRFVSDPTYLDNGLAGATLLELGLLNRIDWVDNIVKVKDDSPLGIPILDQSLMAIKKEKPSKISHWIGVLNANAGNIKHVTLKTLRDKGIIEKKEGKVLWIFNYDKYPTKNDQPENKIRERLKDIVLEVKVPDEKDLMLLGLIRVCQLVREAFREKEVRKRARAWYKKQSSDSKVTKAVASTIQELEARCHGGNDGSSNDVNDGSDLNAGTEMH